jgi:hypothetical protein
VAAISEEKRRWDRACKRKGGGGGERDEEGKGREWHTHTCSDMSQSEAVVSTGTLIRRGKGGGANKTTTRVVSRVECPFLIEVEMDANHHCIHPATATITATATAASQHPTQPPLATPPSQPLPP